MRRQLTPDQALERLENLCSRSEQCTADLRRKLWQWQIGAADADRIIDSLTGGAFVDDARYARAFVRDRYRFSSWGRAKLRAALTAKRIAAPLIASALEEIDSREYQRLAFAAMRSRLRSLDRTDTAVCRQKLLRFGITRGYETDLLLRILDSRSLWRTSDGE